MSASKEEHPQKAERRIPEFRSREEAAEWYDTHDLADYWDELKLAKVRFAKNPPKISQFG